VAGLAQVTDFCEHALFAGVWFDAPPVWAETESEPDIPDALRAGTLVPQGVTGPFPDGLPPPLIHRRHDGFRGRCRLPSSHIGGMDVLNPAFCRTRRLTMTSNAEE
jgi:hypothetical protein